MIFHNSNSFSTFVYETHILYSMNYSYNFCSDGGSAIKPRNLSRQHLLHHTAHYNLMYVYRSECSMINA